MKTYKLDEDQFKMLASITAGIGNAFFAGSVIPFIMGLAQIPLNVVGLTLLDSLGFWTVSVILVGDKKMTLVLDPNNVLSGLMAFSIVGALVLLAIAIVAYPSLKDRYSHTAKKTK